MCRFSFVCLVVAAVASNVVAITTVQKSLIQALFVSKGLPCVKEYPLSAEDINSFKDLKVPSSNNAKCLVACVFKNFGALDKMGKFSPSGARQTARQVFIDDQDSVKKVGMLADECNKVNEEQVSDGDKGCDRAALAFRCFTENAPKHGLNIKV